MLHSICIVLTQINGGSLPLKDARRAHEMIEARQVIGKILLKP